MKNIKLAIVCLTMALAVTVSLEAEAGRIKKPPKGSRTEKTEEMMQAHRFDRLPNMQFVSGVLTRDLYSGWKIGETPLHLGQGCSIYLEGSDEGMLQEGREAVVMGAMFGDAISAWSVRISDPDYKQSGLSPSDEVYKEGENPDVGMIIQTVD